MGAVARRLRSTPAALRGPEPSEAAAAAAAAARASSARWASTSACSLAAIAFDLVCVRRVGHIAQIGAVSNSTASSLWPELPMALRDIEQEDRVFECEIRPLECIERRAKFIQVGFGDVPSAIPACARRLPCRRRTQTGRRQWSSSSLAKRESSSSVGLSVNLTRSCAIGRAFASRHRQVTLHDCATALREHAGSPCCVDGGAVFPDGGARTPTSRADEQHR